MTNLEPDRTALIILGRCLGAEKHNMAFIQTTTVALQPHCALCSLPTPCPLFLLLKYVYLFSKSLILSLKLKRLYGCY